MTHPSRFFFSVSALSISAVSFLAIAGDTSGSKPADSEQVEALPQRVSAADRRASLEPDAGTDLDITVRIRKEISGRGNLSASARKVKIITTDGRVVLKGTVTTAAEKRLIGGIAVGVLRKEHVDNRLVVQPAPSAPTGLRVVQ